MAVKKQRGGYKITFPDVAIDVHTSGKDLAGIGKVRIAGRLMRSAEEMILPAIVTPDGLLIHRYELVRVIKGKTSVTLRTRPVWRTVPKMEWTEHAMHALTPTDTWSGEIASPKSARLDITLKPVKRKIDGRPYTGFEYGFSYRCKGRRIYQILDRATWELDGNVNGDSFIMRNTYSPPIVHIKPRTEYATCWFMPGGRNPWIFQFLPLYQQLQGFTFQYDDAGAMVTVHKRPSHVRSLFQRRRGEPRMLHFNQFCFDLTDTVDTPPRQILYATRPGGDDETGLKNHFLRLREDLVGKLCRHYGHLPQRNRPSAKIETWKIAKTENMPEIFRTAKEWGFNRAFFMPMWASPTTEMNTKIRGTKSHPKLSKYAGWRFGNMCCPLAMDIAPDYGGWRGFRKIMTSAREAGLELYMWFGGHFSRHSTVPEARIWATDQCGQNQRNNYNGGLHVANIRDPRLFNYYFNNFKKCSDAGLAGLFRDGHFNLCVDTINYLPGPGTTKGGSPDQIGRLRHDPSPEDAFPLADIQDFHDAEAELQRKVQRELGMIYYVESAGILGMPMTGTYYKHLRGNEWLFQDVATHCSPKEAREHGMPYRLAYFRAMACRLSFNILMDPNEWKGPEKSRPRFLNDSFIAMIKGFGRVEDDLDVMHVLPDDRGIRWTTKDGKTETIFAYKAFDLDVPEGAKVTDVVADAPASVARGKARCKAMRIYQVAGV